MYFSYQSNGRKRQVPKAGSASADKSTGNCAAKMVAETNNKGEEHTLT